MQDKIFGNGISSRFKEFREKLGLTQHDFAKNLGVEQAAISKIENGRRQLDIGLLRSLLEVFQIDINWLLLGDNTKVSTPNQPLDPDPEIASLMEGARRVLTSGNHVAFRALEQNIRYFDHAIAAEKRADETERKIAEIQKNFEDAMETMEAMRAELAELRRENLRFANKAAEEQSSEKKVA